MNDPPMLPFGEGPQPTQEIAPVQPDLPLIYVASPLTRTATGQERAALLFQIDKIITSISDRDVGSDRMYRTHAPAMHSSPWVAQEMSPAQIFESNTSLVLTEADAMIILALNGGSDGTGQELALANQRGIPILRLSPMDEPVSRQITGNPLVVTKRYETPDQMSVAITQFIAAHRQDILDGPRRRRSKTLLYLPVQTDLASAWNALDAGTQGAAAAGAQLERTYVGHFLSCPLLTASLPHCQLIAIGASLGVDVSSYFTTFSDALSIPQTEAMFIAKDEYGWSDEESEWLLNLGRAEVAGAGIRRLLLNSPADWLRLKDTFST